MSRIYSLEGKLAVVLIGTLLVLTIVSGLVYVWLGNAWIGSLVALCIGIPMGLILMRTVVRPINRVLLALNDGFSNFLDNDFSVALVNNRKDELGELVTTYNRVSDSLRKERLYIYQRELLLDTVIQSTPLSLLLIDDQDKIIYSNHAARDLFNQGRAINGSRLEKQLGNLPIAFSQAMNSKLSGLFTVKAEDCIETYHLSQNHFLLNGRKHRLFLLKVLTQELNRQEVTIWKKVIRLISHELNNSLAPISSLAHSGQLLSEKSQQSQLKALFETVEERAKHLHQFIDNYAEFARLPKPQIEPVGAEAFFNRLLQLKSFKLDLTNDSIEIHADPAQLEQAIINLVKNALESGSDEREVVVRVTDLPNAVEIQVKDRGKGMSDKSMTHALLPFYSTKSQGTGLGLPLCKEIIEAHGGRILLANRIGGGLKVTLQLPQREDILA